MKCFVSSVVCLLIGVGIGMLAAPAEPESGPVFVTEGDVYDGQVDLLNRFVEGCLARDPKACAALYTDDAIYMVQDQPQLEGYDAVLKDYETLFAVESTAEVEMAEPVQEVLSMGDYAVIRGTGYNIESNNGESKKMTYKWVILSKRQPDGSWQMVWDIYNYDDKYDT